MDSIQILTKNKKILIKFNKDFCVINQQYPLGKCMKIEYDKFVGKCGKKSDFYRNIRKVLFVF